MSEKDILAFPNHPLLGISNVLEGIAVFNKENNSQLENNPYLKAPADIKKAAA